MNKSIYARHLDLAVDRVASFFNSDPNSESYGCFDRYYWGWKKRDFADSTLQYALVPYLRAADCPDDAMSIAAFRFIEKVTHANGSCDQSYPFEGHPKTFLDVVPVVLHIVQNPRGTFDSQAVDAAKELLRRGMDFSLVDENYAFIANHVAHDAYQYLSVARALGSEKYYRYGVAEIARIAKNTHVEGWHTEYQGADPGYQTRSLRYLTKCLALLEGQDRVACESLCIQSAEFLDKAVLPDGTLYAMFGSRNTALLYASGIEFMARNYGDRFANLASRVRASLESGKAIHPLQLEFDNFIRLFDDFIDADEICGDSTSISVPQSLGAFELNESGLRRVELSRGHSLYVQSRFGGAIAIYDHQNLLYRDGGLVLTLSGRKRFLGTRNLLHLSDIASTPDGLEIRTELFESIHQDLSPLKLIVIRMLNLTILRVKWIANLFRKVIVRTIIVGSRNKSPGCAVRRIRIEENAVQIEDEIESVDPVAVCHRRVNLNLFHMASSRYAHPVERRLPREETLEATQSSQRGKSSRLFFVKRVPLNGTTARPNKRDHTSGTSAFCDFS